MKILIKDTFSSWHVISDSSSQEIVQFEMFYLIVFNDIVMNLDTMEKLTNTYNYESITSKVTTRQQSWIFVA